ncbi:vacuolar protein 14 C-terminal Fig4p binding-domain-containing protein, partial [Coemansia spiralis]
HPSVIPAALAKALSDRLYDKQRSATLKIERLVLDALDADDEQKIYHLIAELSTDYATSEREAARIGGLVALAATAVALTHINIRPFLPHMVPPMVSALSDGESKVRYFACESLYNVAKVSRGNILRWFNDIFDGLARVTADSVKTVKDGADYLDRLIKDIVAEQAAVCLDWYESESPKDNGADEDSQSSRAQSPQQRSRPRLAFSLEKFVPLLSERMHTYKPSTRLYLIEWIRVLDSVPGLDIIGHLPEFLDGLLRFLSDPNDDVRNKTQSLLGELLNEITECVELQQLEHYPRSPNDLGHRSSTVSLMSSALLASGHLYGMTDELRMAARRKKIRSERASNALVPGAQVVIEFARCMEILIPHLESNDLEIQGTALGWVYQFTWLCADVVVGFVPQLVNAVLPSVSHPMAPHRHTAEDVNRQLYDLVSYAQDPVKRHVVDAEHQEQSKERKESNRKRAESVADGRTRPFVVDEPFNYEHAATSVMELFAKNVHEPTKVAGMQWLLLLHRKAPWRILTPDDMSFPVLLKMLSDSSESVVKLDLELFAQISQYHSHESESEPSRYLAKFLGSLLQMFATDRVLLETRAALMVRQLCVVLDPQVVFCLFARLLVSPGFVLNEAEGDVDLEFVSVMVQQLGWVLVTAPETEPLRSILRRYDAELAQEPLIAHELFTSLFPAWCHNPASCLTLCLLSQHYEISSELVRVFGQLPNDLTVSFLVQLDKLVQLLESPVFTPLRLQLLDASNTLLVRTLYGLLMLLPQSSAFAILRNRLSAI